MMIIPIILIAGAIYLIYKKDESNNHHKDNSLNILNERLARGEISEEEYNKIKNTLNK